MNEKPKKKKSRVGDGILIVIILVGLVLLLYPGISNYLNQSRSSEAILEYTESLSSMDRKEYDRMLTEARKHNVSLLLRASAFQTSGTSEEDYERLLSVGGNPVMGYVEIEKLGVSLPIYHGADEKVLQRAAGHLEWSSLPIGGESTHCVLSAHRGLPSARLFTDLDKLEPGDTFTLSVLDRTLTYEVDQVLVVLPSETDELMIENGKDYCTLLTCTPYGINTHRLLVRGHRTEKAAATGVRLVSEALKIQQALTISVAALPLLLTLLIGALCRKPGNKTRRV